MATERSQYIENLLARVDSIVVSSATDLSRVLALYIKVLNNRGVVNNVSISYIDGYDGSRLFKRFSKYFNTLHEMFLRNSFTPEDMSAVMRRVATRVFKIPTTNSEMEFVFSKTIEESVAYRKAKKLRESRTTLVNKFKLAIKRYLHLTYMLGFNEPSKCVKHLIETHKIDKYIMSGDFSVMLLPFLPEIESELKSRYENYMMSDAWDMLKGMYFNHRDQFMTLAVEIKSTFRKSIVNFSDYFDTIYIDTYYKAMLKCGRKQDD